MSGEQILSEWMAKNAFVCWVETPEPWHLEAQAIRELDLPLNLSDNKSHAFWERLTACRAEAKLLARNGPIAP